MISFLFYAYHLLLCLTFHFHFTEYGQVSLNFLKLEIIIIYLGIILNFWQFSPPINQHQKNTNS